jgi:RNA polymerase sigma factor (sigma-70 family)
VPEPGPLERDVTPQLQELVRQYSRLIRSVVSRAGGPRAALIQDDVEQEIRISLWRRLRSGRELEATPSYVYKAAVRETVRMVRKVLRHEGEPLPEGNAEPAVSPPPMLERQQDASAIEAALRGLPPEREAAVRLHLMGYEVAEVMRLRGWPYQKARNLVARGMADLRQALRDRGLSG